MAKTLVVRTIKAASSDGKPRLVLTQGENKIRLRVDQARSLAAAINRKFGKSLAFLLVFVVMSIGMSHAQTVKDHIVEQQTVSDILVCTAEHPCVIADSKDKKIRVTGEGLYCPPDGCSPELLTRYTVTDEGSDQRPKATVDKKAVTPTGTHSVTLTVTPPTGGGTVTGYIFLRATTNGGPYTQLVPGTSSTVTYIDTQSLVEGTTYYYVAEATGPGGTSGNSPQATATIPFLPPGIPSGLSAAAQ